MNEHLDCPHCHERFDYSGDTEGFDQDSEHEFTCECCGEVFLATVMRELSFDFERKIPDPNQEPLKGEKT